MRAVSLFSGGGGMDFALAELGVDVVFSNDICQNAVQTLKKHFPHSDVVHGDIREITKVPDVDLLVGGYPCQSFSLGGLRKPSNDARTYLFREYARILSSIKPNFFIAENVSGMAGVEKGQWFQEQLSLFRELGYEVSHSLLNARDFGVPQRRRRILIVGVKRELGLEYVFPARTHGSPADVRRHQIEPYTSHGEAIRHLPIDAPGEYYERPHDPTGHMSWYYMSRNRKAKWAEPSFCIVANFRHITLHPACQTMECVWSNLKDGFKQKWEFSGAYEHTISDPSLPKLEVPRRLSWREAAAIQTFPAFYEPVGDLEKKFEQIGNAVPPLFFKQIVAGLVDGSGLRETTSDVFVPEMLNQLSMFGT